MLIICSQNTNITSRTNDENYGENNADNQNDIRNRTTVDEVHDDYMLKTGWKISLTVKKTPNRIGDEIDVKNEVVELAMIKTVL